MESWLFQHLFGATILSHFVLDFDYVTRLWFHTVKGFWNLFEGAKYQALSGWSICWSWRVWICTVKIGQLTHWGWDKMIAISQTFLSVLLEWKVWNFKWNFNEICYLGPNWQYGNIGSDNCLAPNRRQAIIWTNDGLGYWRIYASLSFDELTNISTRL